MHDPRAALLLHNSGHWQGCFIRLSGEGREEERFPTTLQIEERHGIVETCLTYEASGRQRSMNFQTLPHAMQVSEEGGWSLGPSAITPFGWVGELCVVNQQQRRRIIVRHGFHGLEQVVYVVEALGELRKLEPDAPLLCPAQIRGDWMIWQPEAGVELCLDTRDRQAGEATLCGLRWRDQCGRVRQIVRRYDVNGLLEPLASDWP